MQVPIGLEADHEGIIDLVSMKALYFDGENGETIREEEIPSDLMELATEKREALIDAATIFSDELTEMVLEELPVPEEMLIEALRKGTLERQITPVFMGSAYKNRGVQPLLNAVTQLFPVRRMWRIRPLT
jgi:elongation factor G